MKKVKNRITAYINENLKHEDQFDSIKNKLNLQKKKKMENYSYMSNSRVLKITLSCMLVIIAVVVAATVLGRGPILTTESKPAAVIQLDVNPSVSLVVDENEVVLSVYGENDEGKMIINDEEIVGLKLTEAIQKIITIESETGYLLKGNVSVKKNNISISIEAKTDEIAKKVQNKVSSTINKVCNELNIEENLEIIKTASKEQLVKRAMELDPTLTEEEANAMSIEELVAYISACQLEKIDIPTEEIEKLYDRIKKQEIQLVEKEASKVVIDGLDSTYQFLIDNYDELYNGLINAQNALNEAYVKYFINEDSTYQKALREYQNKKLEVLKLENEISQMEESVEKDIQLGILQSKKMALESQLKGLELTKQIADTGLNLLNQALDIVLQEMEQFYNDLPSDVKTEVNESLSDLEDKINEIKDEIIEEFETKYKDEIEQAYQNSKEYKESLIDQLKGK